MSTAHRPFMLFALFAAATGCAYVNSTQNATQTVSGELWYVKERSFFGITFASSVFHCDAPGAGPARCREASVKQGDSLETLLVGTVQDTKAVATATPTTVPAAIVAPSASASAPRPDPKTPKPKR